MPPGGKVGLLPHQVCVWAEEPAVLTRCDYMWDYEPLLYGWVQGQAAAARAPAAGRRRPRSGRSARPSRTARAACTPPRSRSSSIRRPIEYHTRVGEIIYEPFSGSGTALIAAEMTGRSCYAMELSPAFCDAATRRWQNFTGRKATTRGAAMSRSSKRRVRTARR